MHLLNLKGDKATTQNVNNVYPYNPAADQIMDTFDRKLITNDELDAAFGDLVGKMIICDISGHDGQDFRISKVTRKIDSDNLCVCTIMILITTQDYEPARLFS